MLSWLLAFPLSTPDSQPGPGRFPTPWRHLLDRVQLTGGVCALRSTSAVRQEAAARLGALGRVLTWLALALALAGPVLCVAFVVVVAW